MPVDLGREHFISIEALLERMVGALRSAAPWAITRWADSSNWVMSHGDDPVQALQYREGFLTRCHFPEYKVAFLAGVAASDVLGVFANDVWTKQVMDRLGLNISGKPLVYAWCNRQINARREFADEVLGKPWRTALVGNAMPQYRAWLAERFPLEVVQCDTARDWPEVKASMARFAETKPQLVLAGAGWYTSCLMGAAKAAGAVAWSCGHMPDDHLQNAFLPNTEFPRGPDGTAAHARKYFPFFPNAKKTGLYKDGHHIEQSREIVL